MVVELGIYGVRGSAPIAHLDYMKYGGNTASFTIRTPENSLLFLDAGTGLKVAEEQLTNKSENIHLLLSHTHADHIVGFGLSKLANLNLLPNYSQTKLKVIGPSDVSNSLSKFYDGEAIWPVKFTKSDDIAWAFESIDYDNIIEYTQDNQEISIDPSCKVYLLQGNHPVKSSVILYKIEIEVERSNKIKIVYATDNEFDYLPGGIKNPDRIDLIKRYKSFIENADLLIAEAQYSKEIYNEMRGYGHSYPEQIIEIASSSKVKRLLITHHDHVKDDVLDRLLNDIRDHANHIAPDLQVDFAREGKKIIFE